MLKIIKNKLINLGIDKFLFANFLRLVSTNFSIQIISYLGYPLLTRVYNPDTFGIIATFLSIISILNGISILKFELAIPVPKDDNESILIINICFSILLITTILFSIILFIWKESLLFISNNQLIINYIYIIPLGVFLISSFQIFNNIAIRERNYKLISNIKIVKSFSTILISLSLYKLNSLGLILGNLISQFICLKLYFLNFKPLIFKNLKFYKFFDFKTFQRYKDFAIFSAPASLLNIISRELPILIFANYFTIDEVGQFFLIQKIILIPAGIIGDSISQIFLSNAAELYRKGKLQDIVGKISNGLIFFSIIFILPISFLSRNLIPFILGSNWSNAASLLPLFIPLFIGQISTNSISPAFSQSHNNKNGLFAQILLLSIKLSPLLIALNYFNLSFKQIILVYSFSTLVGNIFFRITLSKTLSTKTT